MALTGRKQAFADALLGGKTKTQAAIVAGLSEKTAAQAGSRLAKDKDVVAYLNAHAPQAQAEPAARDFVLPDGQNPFGQKPVEPPPATEPKKRQTAREFLADRVNDPELDVKLRLDAAKKLIEYEEAKPTPMGKKAAKQVDAGKAAGGRFAAAAAPKLAAANGKRI